MMLSNYRKLKHKANIETSRLRDVLRKSRNENDRLRKENKVLRERKGVSLDELNKEFDKRIVHNIQEADDFGIGYNCALSELKRFFGTEPTGSDHSKQVLNAPEVTARTSS